METEQALRQTLGNEALGKLKRMPVAYNCIILAMELYADAKVKNTKVKNLVKPDVRRSLSTKKILQMIIDWDGVTKKYEGDYENWWKKYPSYSHNDVITEAKKKLNCA